MQREKRAKGVTSPVPAVLPVPPPLRIALNMISDATHRTCQNANAQHENGTDHCCCCQCCCCRYIYIYPWWCPIATICVEWTAAQGKTGTQPRACSDEAKRFLAASFYNYVLQACINSSCTYRSDRKCKDLFRININVHTLPYISAQKGAG